MMKKLFVLLILSFLSFILIGQKSDYEKYKEQKEAEMLASDNSTLASQKGEYDDAYFIPYKDTLKNKDVQDKNSKENKNVIINVYDYDHDFYFYHRIFGFGLSYNYWYYYDPFFYYDLYPRYYYGYPWRPYSHYYWPYYDPYYRPYYRPYWNYHYNHGPYYATHRSYNYYNGRRPDLSRNNRYSSTTNSAVRTRNMAGPLHNNSTYVPPSRNRTAQPQVKTNPQRTPNSPSYNNAVRQREQHRNQIHRDPSQSSYRKPSANNIRMYNPHESRYRYQHQNVAPQRHAMPSYNNSPNHSNTSPRSSGNSNSRNSSPSPTNRTRTR